MTAPTDDDRDAYRVAFECANDAIFFIDPATGVVERMNRQAESLLGRAADDVVGRPCGGLFPPDQAERCQRVFRDHVAAGRAVTPHMRVLRGDGTEVPVEVSSAIVQLWGRDVMCCVFRDMTERYRFEERLRRSQHLEAVTRLASGVAHDFNNLLMALLGSLDLLAARVHEVEALRLIGEAKDVAGQGVKLARTLLSLGRPPARPERLDLGAITRGLQGVLAGLLGERAALELRLWPGDLPVVARSAELEQVILNLVLNARDASPVGGRVRVETLDVDGVPPRVALTVSDEGAGIEPADRERIFAPFFTTKPTGTGLGLTLVDGLVRQLGGRVDVQSAPGQGASFMVVLPRAEPSAGPGTA